MLQADETTLAVQMFDKRGDAEKWPGTQTTEVWRFHFLVERGLVSPQSAESHLPVMVSCVVLVSPSD